MAGESITLITAIVGAVCGVAGAILGVINILHQMQRDKIRLKVTPHHAIPVGSLENAPVNFGIEVINLSEFPVVIEDVGFQLADKCHGTLSPVPGLQPKGKLPLRVEPRTAYSKLFHLDKDTIDWANVRCAYAQTQCGTTVTGTSPALKQIIREGTAHVG